MPEHDDGWRRQILHFLETEPDKCTAMVINWCAKKRRIDIPGGPEQVAEYVCAMARDHFRYEDLTDAERAATEPHTAYWKRIDSILSASRQRYSRRANFAREQKMVGNVHWLRPTHNDGRLDREFIAFVRGQDPNLDKFAQAMLYEDCCLPRELAERFHIPIRKADGVRRKMRRLHDLFMEEALNSTSPPEPRDPQSKRRETKDATG